MQDGPNQQPYRSDLDPLKRDSVMNLNVKQSDTPKDSKVPNAEIEDLIQAIVEAVTPAGFKEFA